MFRGRIDISRDMEGEVLVLACIDLGEEDVRASAHAAGAIISERYRVRAISGDDVVKLRELTALADELSEPGAEAAARTLVLSPARLNLYRETLTDFADSRSEAEWIRDEDREALARVHELLPGLGALAEEAIRAALSPVSQR
jgi:hypothetical protein